MMKFSMSSVMFFICFTPWAFAQCPPGVLALHSDEEITAFIKQYPNCSELDSSLYIGPARDMKTSRISSISSLKNITKVHGDLIVEENPWLESINPLCNINYIQGNFVLQKNEGLKTGLIDSKLERIDGDLKLSAARRISDPLFSFPSLIKIGGSLEAYSFKPFLIQFPLLWKIGGNVRLSSDSGEYAEGEFPELEIIKGDLTIYFDYIQADFNGFNTLKKVGSIFMHNSSRFKTYFGSIEECGSLSIHFKTEHEIYGLNKIKKLEHLNITGPSAKLIASFKQLEEVRYLNVKASQGDSMQMDFPVLTKVESFQLSGPIRTSLFSEVDTMPNVQFNNIHDFNLDDLQDHKNVIEKLEINNSSIKEIPSLGNKVKSIKLSHLKDLTELNGEAFSKEPINKFWLDGNNSLTDISGVDKMNCQECKIVITYNKRLNRCATDLVCQRLMENRYDVIISGNGEQCTSVDQVLKECEGLKKE